ncbi:MAG: ECF transporter S component [Eggerthellaceae bacterium]|nr:ECF transporter S component [Eggerthellaceae bacterium]MDR2715991.1 ECF transporter S component [Coriobacteriaceae bacterium]
MRRVLRAFEVLVLVAVPAVLILCAFLRVSQTAVLTLVVALVALVVFFASYEVGRPTLRQVMPTVVLGALAAAGRMLFAAVPNVKPVTAVCIVAGVVFGRRAGFMVGALAAFVSNFFFGQGPWTPWQMYAWGMAGYFAGVLAESGLFAYRPVVYGYGFLAAMLYGVLLNSWYIVGFVQPLTWQGALLAYGASLPFDAAHGVATVAFLLVIFAPWRKKLERIKKKYGPSEMWDFPTVTPTATRDHGSGPQ